MTIHTHSNLLLLQSIMIPIATTIFMITVGCENPIASNSQKSSDADSHNQSDSLDPVTLPAKPANANAQEPATMNSDESKHSKHQQQAEPPTPLHSQSQSQADPHAQAPQADHRWAALNNALYQRIKKNGASVGLSKLEEDSISLFGGNLILSAIEKNFQQDHPLTYHMHIRVLLPNQDAAHFEVCSPGIGETKHLGSSRAITNFVNQALGPVVSVVKHWPVLGANRFWAGDNWGVSDFYGYVGRLNVRGEFNKSKLVNSKLWSEIPGLPRDGQVHLLKLQLEAAAGKWRRTIELDGHNPLVENESWKKIRAPLGFTSVSQFALLTGLDPVSSIEVRKKAVAVLESASDWLTTSTKCLAEHLPNKLVSAQAQSAVCEGGRLLDCVYACKMEVGDACYNAAVDLKYVSQKYRLAELLFYRACLLGHASGCTNAMAARSKGRRDACSIRTYKLVCDKASDPWACTMYAYALSENRKKTKTDVKSIRTAIEKACKSGPQDPACKFAKRLENKL